MRLIIFVSVYTLLLLCACEKEEIEGFQGEPLTPPEPIAYISTNFTNSWNNWRIQLADTIINVQTSFSSSWNNWKFTGFDIENGTIRTDFSTSWGRWKLNNTSNTITIRTLFSNNYRNWEVRDQISGKRVEIRAQNLSELNAFRVVENGLEIMTLRTNFGSSYNQWRAFGQRPEDYSLAFTTAILFVPIFVGAIYEQEIID